MEVICVNDLYTTDQWEVWKKYGVEIPIENTIYHVRDVVKSQQGVGFLLEEIVNPLIPSTGHPLGVDGMFEPNFGVFRFRSLNMEKITESQIRDFQFSPQIEHYDDFNSIRAEIPTRVSSVYKLVI